MDIRQSYEDASPEMIMSNCRKLEMKWCLIESKRTKDILDLNGMKDLGYAQLLLECLISRRAELHGSALGGKGDAKPSNTSRACCLRPSRWTSHEHSKNETRMIEPNLTLHHRLNRLYKRIFRGFQNIRTHVGSIEDIACPGVIQGAYGADRDLFKPSTGVYAPGIIEELSPFQRALYVCLNETYERNMRRYKGMCCLERIVDGYHTRVVPYTISKARVRSPINSVDDVWKT